MPKFLTQEAFFGLTVLQCVLLLLTYAIVAKLFSIIWKHFKTDKRSLAMRRCMRCNFLGEVKATDKKCPQCGGAI